MFNDPFASFNVCYSNGRWTEDKQGVGMEQKLNNVGFESIWKLSSTESK